VIEHSNCAIHFLPEAAAAPTGQVLGRQSATAGFVRAFVEHGRTDTLYCCAPSKESFAGFQRLVAECGSQTPAQWVPYTDPAALTLAGCLHQPDPGIAELAWHRQRFGSAAFSLSGVTHTLCSTLAIDMLAGLAIAPVEPWDALVCTSRAAKVVVENVLESWSEYLTRRLGASRGVEVSLPIIPLGVDCAAFDCSEARLASRAALRERLHIRPGDVAILYVGRLSYHAKAHPLPMYLAAEEVARRTGKGLHLLHFGWFANQAQKAHFVSAAQQLCPSVTAHFLDDHEDWRADVWHAADIFVSLSDNIQETFGLTPLEAMAASLPQVVSDWSGYRDTVRHGIDGFRVPTLMPPPGTGAELMARYTVAADTYDLYVGNSSQSTAVDVACCADALERLVGNESLRATMGQAARKRAEEVYDWRVVIRAYQELWRELGARRKASAASPDVRPRRHPLREDPFTIFAEFATCTLDSTCVVDLGSNASRLRAISAMPMNRFASCVACSEEEVSALVDVIADEAPVLIGDLLERVPTVNRPIYFRTLGWLAKMDVIRITGLAALLELPTTA
jgi:alpha-maltose-1-phosphate synthase